MVDNLTETTNIITLELQELQRKFLHNHLALDMILASRVDICQWSKVAVVCAP